jgi:hypothetical protein
MAKYVILPVVCAEQRVDILDSKMVNKDRCINMTPLESPYGKTYGLTQKYVNWFNTFASL